VNITHDQARSLLAQCGGNVSEAARRAGMSRATWRCKFGGLRGVAPAKKPDAAPSGDVSGVGVVICDMHMPHEDREVLDVISNYVARKYRALDYLIYNGDGCDLHMISRWAKDPHGMPLHEEIAYARNSLEEFNSRFTVLKDTYYIEGNHEERMQAYLHSRAPEIAKLRGLTVPEQLGLDELGIKYINNKKLKHETKRYFSIGKLHILHGHEQGICPTVAPARRYLAISGANIMVGHVHRIDQDHFRSIENKSIAAWCVGAACNLYPDYRPQNSWKSGFAVVEWDSDGTFSVQNHEIIEGVVR
jgi:hypothetical protein